jgi:hypothetical protein
MEADGRERERERDTHNQRTIEIQMFNIFLVQHGDSKNGSFGERESALQIILLKLDYRTESTVPRWQ